MSSPDHNLKIFWGLIFAGVLLLFISKFAKSVGKAQGVKYNWLAVLMSFLVMGGALYLVFFVQL